MTLEKKISSVKVEIDETVSKIQQLAQMQDQLISQQNKLVGKLEAYEELLKESAEADTREKAKTDALEEKTDERNADG
jgi:small-conductance mechanosensitive channel